MLIKSIKIGKLIRDQLPGIMQSQGMTLHKRSLEDDEFLQRLKEKLLEETREVIASQNLEELTEELADVLEVIASLSKLSGISMEQIESKRLEKRESKGGFDQRIFMDQVDMEENNPNIKYFNNYAK